MQQTLSPEEELGCDVYEMIFLALLTLVLCVAASSAQQTEDYSMQSVTCSGTCGRGRR